MSTLQYNRKDELDLCELHALRVGDAVICVKAGPHSFGKLYLGSVSDVYRMGILHHPPRIGFHRWSGEQTCLWAKGAVIETAAPFLFIPLRREGRRLSLPFCLSFLHFARALDALSAGVGGNGRAGFASWLPSPFLHKRRKPPPWGPVAPSAPSALMPEGPGPTLAVARLIRPAGSRTFAPSLSGAGGG